MGSPPTIPIDVVLQSCCGKRGRYAIETPFVFDGRVFATDGAQAIWTAAHGPCECDPKHIGPRTPFFGHRRIPDVYRVAPVDAVEAAHYCVPLPSVARDDLFESCASCHGDGEKECDECGHYYECRSCGGSGETVKYSHIKWRGWCFPSVSFARLCALPNVQTAEFEFLGPGMGRMYVRWSIDGDGGGDVVGFGLILGKSWGSLDEGATVLGLPVAESIDAAEVTTDAD